MLKYFFIISLFINGGHNALATDIDLSPLPIAWLMPSSCGSTDNPANVYIMFANNAVGSMPKDKLPKNLKRGEAFRVSYLSMVQLATPIQNHPFYFLQNIKSYRDPDLRTQSVYITPSSEDLTSELMQDASQNIWILDLDNCILQNGLSNILSPTTLGIIIEQKIQDTKNKPAGVLFLTKRDQASNKVLSRTIEELKILFPALYAFSISSDNVLSDATSNPDFTPLYTSSGPVIIMGDGTHTPCKGEALLTLLKTVPKELQNRILNLNFLCVDDQMRNCTAYATLSFQTIRFLPWLYFYPKENT